MLKQLTLKNFLLIDHIEIEFGPGLTTITGESGAGKSILLNALSLILGSRASSETVRPGTERADIVAEFDLTRLPDMVSRLQTDELIGDDPQECLIRRVVNAQGRSKAFVNHVPVTTAYLRELGDQLVDIQGQNEHMRLADRSVQLDLLDEFAGLTEETAKVRQTFTRWQAARETITRLEAGRAMARDRQDFLTYQLGELDELGAEAGEYEALEAEQRRLASAQSTLARLHGAEDALEQLDPLRAAIGDIDAIDDEHASLAGARASLNDALALIDDAAGDLRRYRDQVTVDPERLTQVDERLGTTISLARKHRLDPKDLHGRAEELRAELGGIEADDEALVQATAEAEKEAKAFQKLADKLSKRRRKAVPDFSSAVAGYMRELNMSDGRFEIEFEAAENERGIDRIDFRVSTNASFEPGPLNHVASGGEQTRIALSIQIVAAQRSTLPCLILDEADVGVGGTTADTVGRILRDLGNQAQVICITHAPQVAALGNHHLKVAKQGDATQIDTLSDDLRIEELARMLAGAGITDQTRDYAASLLDAAQSG